MPAEPYQSQIDDGSNSYNCVCAQGLECSFLQLLGNPQLPPWDKPALSTRV